LKRLLCVAALALGLVLPASAAMIPVSVVPSDASGLWITQTFHKCEGGKATLVYGTADPDTLDGSAQVLIDGPDGSAGWITFQVPQEANLTELVFQAKEIDTGLGPASYSWGDQWRFYVGGAYRIQAFQIGAWDSMKVWGMGAATDTVTIWYWTEFNAK
jgi:hypothetical protein